MRSVDGDEERETPPAVVGAVAVGCAPLPFLAVYAVLFIVHGTVHPVVPPDIGNSKGDELSAGLVALAAFVVCALSTYWFLDGRRRWLFAAFQALVLATAIDFVVDSTKGSPDIPILLSITALIALVLAFLPPSWQHVDREFPRRASGSTSAAPPDASL